jgi:deazaflavin-dependent oxidoreductase (nitroreductase family)
MPGSRSLPHRCTVASARSRDVRWLRPQLNAASTRRRAKERTLTDRDSAAFETALIADMRENEGAVTTGPMAGSPLLVMFSTGAKTGEPRRAILAYTRDGGDYVVAGSKGGAPTDPAWLLNLRAEPAVTVEANGRTFRATAVVAAAAERDMLWDQHVAALPQFAEYPEKAGRVIPMVRLTSVDEAN